jgi:tetratricopeptide (TPR) repeat protein
MLFEEIRDPIEAIEYYDEADDSLQVGNHAAALAAFEKAYNADTTCVEALAGMAECYLKLDQVDKAIVFARQAHRKMPQYPESYKVLVDAYVARNKHDQALEWCRQWLRIEPDKSGPNREMAKIHRTQKQHDLAIQEMKNALAIEPAKADLYFELGKLYETTGDKDNALAYYQQGLDWFMAAKENKALQEARAKVALLQK